jgi:hypothetical protein
MHDYIFLNIHKLYLQIPKYQYNNKIIIKYIIILVSIY